LIQTSTETVPDELIVACTVQGSPTFGDPRTFSVTPSRTAETGVGEKAAAGTAEGLEVAVEWWPG